MRIAARGLAVPLALTPLALVSFELGAQLAFGGHAAWIWGAGLWLAVGGVGFVRRAAFLMLVLAAGLRASRREAQPLVVAAVVLSVSVLAATFAHLAVFDFDRLQAWAWLALFAAFGAATTALAVTGPWRREPGPGLPAPARGLLAAVAVALLAAGVALWIDPAAHDLPPLSGRFAGSCAAMLATLAAWPAVRGRRDEARLPALALVAVPAGALAGALRTLGDTDPAYIAALTVLTAAGAAALAAARLGATSRGNTGEDGQAPGRLPPAPLISFSGSLSRRTLSLLRLDSR
jgi:hypothetical protein